MFYLTHPLIICTSFLLFVSAVARGKDLVPVRWCQRVENSYVKEGTLSIPVPKVVCLSLLQEAGLHDCNQIQQSLQQDPELDEM